MAAADEKRVSIPSSLLIGLVSLVVGAGGGIPIYRATAAAATSAASDRLEQLEVRLREVELATRTGEEWRRGVDAKLGEIASAQRETRDSIQRLERRR